MTQPAGQAPDRVPAGTVGKAHGLDGSVYVIGAVPDLVGKGALLYVGSEPEPRTVERRAGTEDRPILRLSGATTRNDADALRGQPLAARIEDAPALGEDEYWAHELVGCSVIAAEGGEVLGEVRELQAYPSCEILRVDGAARGELLIPLIRDAIVEVDAAAKRIAVDVEFLALDD